MSWFKVFQKSVLLRVGCGVGHHVLIALSRNSKRELLVCCWVFLFLLPLSGCLFSRGEYIKNEVFLRIALVCIEGCIYVLHSCLTLASFRMILDRETLTKMMLTSSLEILWKSTTLD